MAAAEATTAEAEQGAAARGGGPSADAEAGADGAPNTHLLGGSGVQAQLDTMWQSMAKQAEQRRAHPQSTPIVNAAALPCAGGVVAAVASTVGWRTYQEDTAMLHTHADGTLVGGVFDGHGGDWTSSIAGTCFAGELDHSDLGGMPVERVPKLLRKTFQDIDDAMRQARGTDTSGSTALLCVVRPTHIVTGHCGDSRAVVVECTTDPDDPQGPRTWQTSVGLTRDHKPSDPREARRIREAGFCVWQGFVTERPSLHVVASQLRAQRGLAMTRSLGDFEFKRTNAVIATPTCNIYPRRGDGTHVLLVMASDGLWDMLPRRALVDMTEALLPHGVALTDSTEATLKEDVRLLAAHLVEYCLQRGSRDNITVCLLLLPPPAV